MGFEADFSPQGISVGFSLFIFGKLVDVWIFVWLCPSPGLGSDSTVGNGLPG